jgi:hypothetical protein
MFVVTAEHALKLTFPSLPFQDMDDIGRVPHIEPFSQPVKILLYPEVIVENLT